MNNNIININKLKKDINNILLSDFSREGKYLIFEIEDLIPKSNQQIHTNIKIVKIEGFTIDGDNQYYINSGECATDEDQYSEAYSTLREAKEALINTYINDLVSLLFHF